MPALGSTAGQVILRFSFAAEFVPIWRPLPHFGLAATFGGGSLTAFRHPVRDLLRPLRSARPFLLQRLAHALELLLRGLVDSRKTQVQRFERAENGRADHYPREPFVIGWHHIPPPRCGRGVP